MLQPVIDKVDDQINKQRSPLVNTLLSIPIFAAISLPLAMVVAVLVIIVTGTTPQVRQVSTMPGIIAGILTIFVFTAWAAYGTYTSNKAMQDGEPL